MMRTVIICLLPLIYLSSCQSLKKESWAFQDLKIKEIYSRDYQGLKNYNENLITHATDFRLALEERGVEEMNYLVDFNKSSIIFVDAGERNTGGYGIDLIHYNYQNDSLLMRIKLTSPEINQRVTMAFSTPFVIYEVNRPNIKHLKIQKE